MADEQDRPDEPREATPPTAEQQRQPQAAATAAAQPTQQAAQPQVAQPQVADQAALGPLDKAVQHDLAVPPGSSNHAHRNPPFVNPVTDESVGSVDVINGNEIQTFFLIFNVPSFRIRSGIVCFLGKIPW